MNAILSGTPAAEPARLAARPIPFYLPFRGTIVRVRPGVILMRATAPSSVLHTTFDDAGVHTEIDVEAGSEAHLEARITLFEDGSFLETGTIGFGGGNAVRFRSTGLGRLGEADADPALDHGTVSCAIDRGSGWFAGASGHLVSNFLVSRTGELTDHQLGLVFRPDPSGAGDRSLAAAGAARRALEVGMPSSPLPRHGNLPAHRPSPTSPEESPT